VLGRCLAVLLCAIVLAISCSDRKPVATRTESASATAAAGSPASAAATLAPATATPLASPVAVTRTEVLTYSPPASASVTATGICFGWSVRVERVGAWSCAVGNEIQDPCFGDREARSVACIRNPWEPDTLIQINLLDRACETRLGTDLCVIAELPPSTRQEARPWAFETAQGSRCGLQRGTVTQYQGEIVAYGCDDGATVVGFPTADTVWTVRVAGTDSGVIETVPLVRVWQ